MSEENPQNVTTPRVIIESPTLTENIPNAVTIETPEGPREIIHEEPLPPPEPPIVITKWEVQRVRSRIEHHGPEPRLAVHHEHLITCSDEKVANKMAERYRRRGMTIRIVPIVEQAKPAPTLTTQPKDGEKNEQPATH